MDDRNDPHGLNGTIFKSFERALQECVPLMENEFKCSDLRDLFLKWKIKVGGNFTLENPI